MAREVVGLYNQRLIIDPDPKDKRWATVTITGPRGGRRKSMRLMLIAVQDALDALQESGEWQKYTK